MRLVEKARSTFLGLPPRAKRAIFYAAVIVFAVGGVELGEQGYRASLIAAIVVAVALLITWLVKGRRDL